jgi:hypothetical protein
VTYAGTAAVLAYFGNGVEEVELVVDFVVSLFVAEELLLLLLAAPPLGFTMVVLLSVFLSPEAGVVAVSVFCSHAARTAAPAIMQRSFFIVVTQLGHK